jgi:hypothetical protein
MAQEAVAQMQRDLTTASAPAKRVLNFDIFGPENI